LLDPKEYGPGDHEVYMGNAKVQRMRCMANSRLAFAQKKRGSDEYSLLLGEHSDTAYVAGTGQGYVRMKLRDVAADESFNVYQGENEVEAGKSFRAAFPNDDASGWPEAEIETSDEEPDEEDTDGEEPEVIEAGAAAAEVPKAAPNGGGGGGVAKDAPEKDGDDDDDDDDAAAAVAAAVARAANVGNAPQGQKQTRRKPEQRLNFNSVDEWIKSLPEQVVKSVVNGRRHKLVSYIGEDGRVYGIDDTLSLACHLYGPLTPKEIAGIVPLNAARDFLTCVGNELLTRCTSVTVDGEKKIKLRSPPTPWYKQLTPGVTMARRRAQAQIGSGTVAGLSSISVDWTVFEPTSGRTMGSYVYNRKPR